MMAVNEQNSPVTEQHHDSGNAGGLLTLLVSVEGRGEDHHFLIWPENPPGLIHSPHICTGLVECQSSASQPVASNP